MAYHAETPSRIWRRIKEGEAREADMPSLPSLPDLDDSGASDLELPSLSLPEGNPKLELRPLGGQSTRIEPALVVPRVNQLHASGNDPTPLPSGASLLANISEVEESQDESSLQGRHEGLNNDAFPTDAKRTGDLGVPIISSRLRDHDQVGEVERRALPKSILMQNAHPSSEYTLLVDAGMARVDGSQTLDGSDKRGSLNNDTVQPRGVEPGEPPDPDRPAITLHPLHSRAPTLGLPSMSNSDLLPWSSNVGHESPLNCNSALETVHASSTSRQEHLGSIQAEERPETNDHDTVKNIASREPTFSSEEAESTQGTGVRFSEVMSFPTDLATPSQPYGLHAGHGRYKTHPENRYEEQGEADDLATPLPRRKSFLLSVVNSSTRPRLAMPTPHPRTQVQTAVTAVGKLTPGPSGLFDMRVKKPRLSHPLSRLATFAPFTPLTNLPEGTRPGDLPEGAANTSFVSTASSHDLTVHHRANASFDPLTGPQGVGRFNAGKLNTYLHGLNRRLQEENELLVNRIRTQQAELEMLRDHTRHRELSGVVEDDAAEQWVVEKESLEQKMRELERLLEVKDKELAEEQALRTRERGRWKERMAEVEDGVGQIVADLERRVQEAEMKSASLKQRAEEAELMLMNRKVSDEVIRPADATTSVAENMTEEMQTLKQHAQGRDDTIAALQASLADKQREATSLKGVIHDLETSLRIARETIETSHQDAKELRSDQRELRDELRAAQATVDRFKSELSIASDGTREHGRQLLEAQEKLSEKQEALEIANERIALSSEELERAKSSLQQLENALEESDKKILADNKALVDLRSRLTMKQRENEKEGLDGDSHTSDVHVNALQAELAEATKEIGRLSAMLDQNPARRALDIARESRIDLLEKENQELLNQLRVVRDASHYTTPRRTANMTGLSPMHRRLINMSLRAPRTPGEPLKNASWLMSMTAGDVSTAQLVEEIGRLQRELDLANESIDDKLDKLEEAGLGVVGLTKALEDARRRIMELESVLDEREVYLPGRYPCPRCGDNVKISPNESLQIRLAAVTTELECLKRRRDEEMAHSSGDKAVLRDATNRLNTEIKRAKEELKVAERRGHKAEKSKAELQQELAKARKTIDDLEFFLQSERTRLRTMSAENSTALIERQKVLEKLHETEQRMEQARDRIFQLKEDNVKLEAELKVQRKTASIEEALIGNRENIERLRRERLELSDRYYELQQQLAETSKTASELATKHAKLQLSYDGRRRQLDQQAREIEILRAALSSQAQKLEIARCDKKDEENARPDSIELRSLACKLEYELKRIQQEANSFGRDLVHLRAERDELIIRHRNELEQHERTTKQIRSQLRNLKQQLANRKDGRNSVSEIQAATEALQLQHNRECKGLFVQIRYLKAKYTREAALRDDLGYQKGYLLVLLSRFQESEKRILASIAQIGSTSSSTTSSPSKSLRTTVLALMFISRARRASEAWREQQSACSAVAAALDNVRKTRAVKA